MPDERLVLRRSMDVGAMIEPWTVGRSGAKAEAWERAHCPADAAPVQLRVADSLGDLRLADVASLEVQLDGPLAGRIAVDGGLVTQDDFPAIIEAIRAEARSEFGPNADRWED